MVKVSVEDALLKKYSDKELVHYIREQIMEAFVEDISGDLTAEAKMAMRLERIYLVLPLLKAVDNRMNGSTKTMNIVL